MPDIPINRIICGDALEVLRTLSDGCVQCVVTSPPYWGLRQYLFDGAVVLKNDTSDMEKEYVLNELAKLGIKPRS